MSSSPWDKYVVEEETETSGTPWDKFEVKEEVKEDPSLLGKGARLGAQVGLGVLGRTAFPYEIYGQLAGMPSAQLPEYRQEIFQEIEDLGRQKRYGKISPEDEIRLQMLIKEQQSPEEQVKQFKSNDVSFTGAIEAATGIDLRPKGVLEKAFNFLGFLKRPSNVKDVYKAGGNAKELAKSLMPKGGELTSALGGGTVLELAEQGQWGPIGTLAALTVSELATRGAVNLASAAKTPKKSLAKIPARLVKEEKRQIQQDLIRDFRDLGIQADIGTLTDSNLLNVLQTTLSQSGLTGKPLEEFRNRLLSSVKQEYGALADSIGKYRFETSREASEVGKKYLLAARDEEKELLNQLYGEAKANLAPSEKVKVPNVRKKIDEIIKDLEPGSLKTTDQKKVLDALNKMAPDLRDNEGTISSLINNKRALQDLADYEVQGGTKQLLKGVAKEIDNSLLQYGKENPDFANKFLKANRRFKQHADTYRNTNIDRIIRSEDPELLFQKMNSIQGIKDLEKALSKTAPGRQTFNDLKRLKFDQMVGNKMTDNVSEQLKLGTFANLLKNPKDAQLVKELLGKESFSRLQKLQKNIGKMANSSQKFYNASKTSSQTRDFATIAGLISGVTSLMGGNPWGFYNLAKITGGILTAKQLSKLMADPGFLKYVEEAILAGEKNQLPEMKNAAEKLMPYVVMTAKASQEKPQENKQ